MSIITPDTYIKLVRFDVTKEHQITFSSLQTQLNYFENLSGEVLTASTYQRKDFKVRFPILLDKIENYNYLYFRNDTPTESGYYNNKTFFCYITNMEYINENVTDITIKIDVFQTYQFDFIYKQCFIEREHSNTDTLGSNVISEGLEKGEFVTNTIAEFTDYDKYCYLVQVTKDLSGNDSYGIEFSGVYFVGGMYLCMTYSDVTALVRDYTESTVDGVTYNSILNVYLVPFKMTELANVTPQPTSRKILASRNVVCE